ncbi:MAG: nucleic acid/nucleotide deaminase domain-containing protein [Candidatus Methylacidiphilales bacterium]
MLGLSELAQAYRNAEKISGARNVAVFEYRDVNGYMQTIARHSVRGVGHAKHLIAKELAEMGVSPSAVSRIYSELEPCCTVRGYCKKFIGKTFQNVKVTWTFEYGATKNVS